VPLIEIIKEKDRKDNLRSPVEIYSEIITKVKAKKVLMDLPIYLIPKVSTSSDVRTFFLSTISNSMPIYHFIHNFLQSQIK
jgi:hypothetical protein